MEDNGSVELTSETGSTQNLDLIRSEPIDGGLSDGAKEQKEGYDKFNDARATNRFTQEESIKKIFHFCAINILRLLAFCVGLLIATRLIHLIFPLTWRWLAKEQIDEMDILFNYIIVGSVGSFVFKYFQNNIAKP